MAQVHQAIAIKASMDTVWAVVRDFQHTNAWLPQVDTIPEGEDRRRVVRTDGGWVVEALREYVEAERRLCYAIVDGEIPFEDHYATLCVLPSSDTSTCIVEWYANATATGMPEEEMIAFGEATYRVGLEALKTYIETGKPIDPGEGTPSAV